jgi:hypothetical protein
MAYTPGPLHFSKAGQFGTSAILDEHERVIGEAFAGVGHEHLPIQHDAEANARLWATSPELLESCKAMYELVKYMILVDGKLQSTKPAPSNVVEIVINMRKTIDKGEAQ